jgi:nitrate/nitrite transporter NarK
MTAFLAEVRHSPATLLLLGGFCCANFVALVLLSWMPKFLYDQFGLSVAISGLSATLFAQFASMGGSSLGGWLADYLQSKRAGGRIKVQAAAMLCGAPFVFLCGQVHAMPVLVTTLIAWGLMKGIYDANIFASLFDVVRIENRGAAAGLLNMVGWLGGGSAPVAVGFLAEHIGLPAALSCTAVLYVLGGSLLLLAI